MPKKIYNSRYEKYKDYRRITTDFIQPKFEKFNDRVWGALEDCGSLLRIIECAANESHKHYSGFIRCKQKWCVPCQWVKAQGYSRLISARARALQEDYWFSMFTLTLRNTNDLKDMINRLEAGWRKLTQKMARREYPEKFHYRFEGGIRSLEIKIGKGSGLWHPHYHVLLATRKGLPFEKDYIWLQKAWKWATDGQGSVEIHKVKQDPNQDIHGAVMEVVKYMLEINTMINLPQVQFEELFKATFKKRQLNTFGLFRFLKSAEVEQSIEDIQKEKLQQFVCAVCGHPEGVLKNVWETCIQGVALLDPKRKDKKDLTENSEEW